MEIPRAEIDKYITDFPKNLKLFRDVNGNVYLPDDTKSDVFKMEPMLIKLMKNPSIEVQLAAVQKNGCAIQFIKDPSEEVQLAAVQKNKYAIQYIKDPSEEVQLAVVQQNGYVIQYIKNPSEEVQLAAVQRNGCAIQFIKDPSEEVQLAAVQQNGRAIQFIKNIKIHQQMKEKEISLPYRDINEEYMKYIFSPPKKDNTHGLNEVVELLNQAVVILQKYNQNN